MSQALTVQTLKTLQHKAPFALYAVITDVADKKAANGSDFRVFTLKDRTGTVPVNVFDNMPCYMGAQTLEVGDVVLMHGTADYFKDQASPRPTSFERLPATGLPKAVADAVYECSPVPEANLMQMLEAGLGAIKHPGLQKVAREILEESPVLIVPPSADGNRPYRRGLLEYICACLHGLAPMFEVYPFVDRDVVRAGILLFATGRAQTSNLVTGVERTTMAVTHGSSIISYATFRREALKAKLEDNVIQAVEHVILSCSVRGAQRPATPEAVLVNAVIDLHENMGIVAQARRTTAGDLSQVMPVLRTALAFLPPAVDASAAPASPPAPPPTETRLTGSCGALRCRAHE